MPIEELKVLGKKGKEKREELEKENIEEINKKYHVS
jgi:hypothetical protein